MGAISLIIKEYYLRGRFYKAIIYGLIFGLGIYIIARFIFYKFFQLPLEESLLVLLSYWAASLGLGEGLYFIKRDKKLIKLLLSENISFYSLITARLLSIFFLSSRMLFPLLIVIYFLLTIPNITLFILMFIILIVMLTFFFLICIFT